MRRRSRDAAFKCLYEKFFKSEINIDDFFAAISEIPDAQNLNEDDKNFVSAILSLYTEKKFEIEKLISEKLIGYDSGRTYKVDLALITLAIIEVNYMQTPCPIAITEVIELAKIYSTEKSPSFIHGLLASIFKGE